MSNPNASGKLDKAKLKSNNAKWNQRAEETFDAVAPLKGRRAKLTAWFDRMEADTRELVLKGTDEIAKAEQLEALDALHANREAGFDMVLDSHTD